MRSENLRRYRQLLVDCLHHTFRNAQRTHALDACRKRQGATTTKRFNHLLFFSQGKLFYQQHQRKRELTAGQVRPQGFSNALFFTEEIHQIVVYLVGDAQVAAKIIGGVNKLGGKTRHARPQITRNAKQLRGFQIDDAPVVRE